MNWLYFLGSEIVGFIVIRYSKWITDNTGRIDIAEQYMGPGGTYTFWKVIGLGLIIFGFVALVNF